MNLLQRFRVRLGDRISSLFSQGEVPLENTADYSGDAGLCGPDSVSWRVIGDVSVFLGAVRALLIQATHPETVAGVDDHSRYRADPMGRLNRTAFYVTSATFGAMPEVEEAVKRVRAAHRPVKGVSHRGLRYSASDPALAAWVHNTLTDSFLVAYQQFGLPISDAEADQFVVEQSRIGSMLGADPLPQTAADLRDWIRYHPDLAPSPGQTAAVHFLRKPPLPFRQRLGYAVLFQGAIATMPPELTKVLNMKPRRGARQASAALLRTLRFGLLDSPAWQASLERCGVDYDSSKFRLTA